MTKDLNINLRPATGPFKSPEKIAKFYNSIDGWQEILPKTDNTYSPESKYYKYEVSPGIRFIPNMSRPPLKSYEKTPMKHDYSEDLSDCFLSSSHIRKKLFTSTTYKHYNSTNHYQTHHSKTHSELKKSLLHTTRSKTSKVISHVYQSVQILIKLIISYFISISTVTEVYESVSESVMEIGSNIISTTIRKITNWVHLATITLVHCDLIVITFARKIIYHYFGATRLNNLVIHILLSALILFLSVGFLKYATSIDTPVWHKSWTNFLVSPFISILNLITSIYQVFCSTMLFVLDLISVTCASSIIAFKLCGKSFLNLFRNINTVVDSGTQHITTIPGDQNSRFIPFDYDLLAKKVIASEEFQKLLMNQLNISQSNVLHLHDKEFQKFFRHQLQDMNSENLNLISNQLNDQKIILKNINDNKLHQDKESIQVIEKKISELQNIMATLIKNFETFKLESTTININSHAASKEACIKEDWHSIINYIEQYVNMTMKSALSIYDADKTGMVDYALESGGATVLGTRCTQTKASTAALTLFGIPLWFISNGPRLAIQPGVNPGQCWAFIGTKGFLVLKLSNTIRVTGFTIEHLPRSLSEDGHIRSAPKDFSIWGLKHETDSNGKLLGKYQFAVDGPSLQYFSALKTDDHFSIAELRIESNHGHEEYTCLYRIRIHGELA